MRTKLWLIVVVVLFLCATGLRGYGQRERTPQVGWEYKVVYIPGVRSSAEKTLNDLGAQGWELVAFVQLNQEGVTIGAGNYYFKRLKQPRP